MFGRANRLVKRVQRIRQSRALSLLTGARAAVDRLFAALDGLRAIDWKEVEIGRSFLAASASSTLLAADIRAVADSVEALLDAIIPSARGSFAD